MISLPACPISRERISADSAHCFFWAKSALMRYNEGNVMLLYASKRAGLPARLGHSNHQYKAFIQL